MSGEPERIAPPAPLGELVRVERITRSGVLGRTTAVIDGRAALILAAILAGSLRDRLTLDRLLERMQLDPASRAAALRAWRALEEAGETWRRLPRRGNAETGGSGTELASAIAMTGSPFLDTQAAAGVLGCSARRVRQLASRGVLAGERTPRGWLFGREAVVALRGQRAESVE